jgi:hypothetical protein
VTVWQLPFVLLHVVVQLPSCKVITKTIDWLASHERHLCVQARDGGNLLTRAGLALPAVDMDQFVVKYATGPTAVISHLRQLGEMNAVLQRQPILSRDTALAVRARNTHMHSMQALTHVNALPRLETTGCQEEYATSGGMLGS